jgi:hypothetical protein
MGQMNEIDCPSDILNMRDSGLLDEYLDVEWLAKCPDRNSFWCQGEDTELVFFSFVNLQYCRQFVTPISNGQGNRHRRQLTF